MWWYDILRCPLCGAQMSKESNSLFCLGARRHCFDFAREGYVNLAAASAAGGGDDAVLIAARTAFLSSGHYAPFAARIVALLTQYVRAGGTVLDAGCGEGYYTAHISRAGYHALGIDLSKRGVRHAAKCAAREELSALFAVAGIYTLPVADASLDAVVSLFAPVSEREFLRVLKPGGVLIVAGAGKDHLLGLKRVLYEVPRQNEPRADLPHGMRELQAETLSFTVSLEKKAIADLFAMTPYYYRTAREAQARLLALDTLSTEIEMDIHVYQK